jgi:nitroreductase
MWAFWGTKHPWLAGKHYYMQDTKTIKAARTERPVYALIKQRFSPRAFSPKAISEKDMNTLFEAASWAPSSMNEQPWRYRYALQGTPAFQSLWQCLAPGNRPWSGRAAALVVCSGLKVHAKDGSPNGSWAHDVGLANAHLLLQATSMGIYGHLLGGFMRAEANALLSLDADTEEIACFLALGYLGQAEDLVEPFRTREATPRSRRPLDATVTAL